MAAGNYRDNPMEVEAYDFTELNALPNPCIGPTWRISKGGIGKWEILGYSGIKPSSLAFGDFTGDGKFDVITLFGYTPA